MGFFDRFRKKDDLTRALEQFQQQNTVPAPAEPSEAQADTSGMFRIDDIFFITGRGLVATGQITSGSFRVGDAVEIVRDGACIATSTITGIEAVRQIRDSAEAGDNIGLLLRGLERGQLAAGDQVRVCETRFFAPIEAENK